jgi:ubiquinone/menaquinone biosynthesis C-methylase UbiE
MSTSSAPPTVDHFQRVAEAFSRKADEYDAFGADHINLARMRRKVYDHLLQSLRPTDRILELNAGTGLDAAFLARQGYAVHAIDIAPGMLDHLADKIAAAPARSADVSGVVVHRDRSSCGWAV